MTPLKNTDKHLSDYLPPALVKDWRQCFRSRSSVALFLLLELAGWLILACMVAGADHTPALRRDVTDDLGYLLYLLGAFSLCLIIPFRAGSTVAADTRVRSSNFLMLTPLSSRRIVWGTWSSTALIILLAALLAVPLLLVRRMMMGDAPQFWPFELSAFQQQGLMVDALILFWLVIVGWVMAAFFMFSAVLPRVLRVILLIACAFVVLDVLNGPSLQLMRVGNAALLLVLFLELTRRHYAAPAENCSRSVRLLAPLPLIIYGLLMGANALWGWNPLYQPTQLGFAESYLLIALLSDALLPGYAMPAHAWTLWRGLPGWLQKPGFVPSTLCLALACLICGLPGMLAAWDGQRLELESFWLSLQAALNLGFSCMLWLLITDCFCRRSAVKRPLVFGVVALTCYLAVLCISLPLNADGLWIATLPRCGGYDALACASPEQLISACISNGAAFLVLLLLLIFWRGRLKNA